MKLPQLFILCSIILLASCTESRSPSSQGLETTDARPALIPLPQTVSWAEGTYQLPAENRICYNKGAEKSAQWLEELLKPIGSGLSLEEGENCGNWSILMDPDLQQQLGEEGYILDITSEGIVLKAAADAGLFYAVQTLRQMLPPAIEKGQATDGQISLHQIHIEDSPKYSWRGTMVDVARSFFGMDYLKQHIDRMALYKLNRLHLHLTDDQGWRIEIKSKPALTETGSKGAVEGGVSGFLSQEEYLELQDYALARNIIIIPEIDMPGHIYAALMSYPELNCPEFANIYPRKATPPDLYTGQEVGWSRFCLTKPDEVYSFVASVVEELADITKGPWIHIGGDEIEDPLYEAFVVKADSIVRKQGKISIGWEEVTKAEVDTSLISQVWQGKVENVVDVKKIMSLCQHFYLDHANVTGQPSTNNWCKETGVSLEDVYSFRTDDPDVIGVEAPVWTELVYTDTAMDNRFWPRLLAFAEVAWTPEPKLDYDGFVNRLSTQSPRLNYMGIHYYATPGVDWPEEKPEENANSVLSGFMPE